MELWKCTCNTYSFPSISFTWFPLFSFIHTHTQHRLWGPNKLTALPCQVFSPQSLIHPGSLSIKMPERWQLLPFAIVLPRRQGDLSLPQQLPGIFLSSHQEWEKRGEKEMKGKNEGERERIKTSVLPQGKETVLVSDCLKANLTAFWGLWCPTMCFLGRQLSRFWATVRKACQNY